MNLRSITEVRYTLSRSEVKSVINNLITLRRVTSEISNLNLHRFKDPSNGTYCAIGYIADCNQYFDLDFIQYDLSLSKDEYESSGEYPVTIYNKVQETLFHSENIMLLLKCDEPDIYNVHTSEYNPVSISMSLSYYLFMPVEDLWKFFNDTNDIPDYEKSDILRDINVSIPWLDERIDNVIAALSALSTGK